MVKATRRVKRVKRSKKQVHRARDRKTNRRHKTNRRRYTRRQRGGAIIKVCEKSGFDLLRNSKGISISYNDVTQWFKIGTQPTISDLETFNGKTRYERAVRVLRHIYDKDESTQLNWYNFARFANMYCYNNAADPQCAQITGFVNHYKDENKEDGKIVDKNGSVKGRTIKTSIEQGEKQANNATSTRFKNSLGSSGASAASGASALKQVAESLDLTIPNQLKVNEQYIAYMNHSGIVKGFQVDKSKTEYEFDNFTIQLGDSVITGTLAINLATRSFELGLDLNGRENTNTPAFIGCMKGLNRCGPVTVTDVKRKSTLIRKDKLTVNGTVELEKKDDALFVSNFQTFVTEFAEQYKFCTTPVGQNLENAEEINRSDAGALVILIKGKIKTLDTKMPSDTEYKKLKQEFEEFIKPHEGSRMDSTKENLDVLNRIHDKLKIMKPQTKPPIGDELSERLAALNLD